MKKNIFMAVVGLVCVALMGCKGQENSTGGTQGSEQSAEEFLEQLDEEYQEMVEAEEEQHEAELEAEYPEGILPAGKYQVVDRNGNNYINAFWAEYDAETGEGLIRENDTWHTIPQSYNLPFNCYQYDPETGLYHFEIYYAYAGEWNLLETIEGYYKAEDDTFVMTSIYSEKRGFSTEEGYECVYQRE